MHMDKKIVFGALIVALLSLMVSVISFSSSSVGNGAILQGDPDPTVLTDLTLEDDLIVTDDASVGGDLSVSGQATIAGQINNTPDAITATTTLTADSSTIQFLATSSAMATITLPPVSVSGTKVTFVVTGPLTGSSVVIDSAEGDNIEGILMVNDADVVCDAEDQLNIVTDGEVIGDRVSLISNGGNWFILDSDIDAAGKMTCTDPS